MRLSHLNARLEPHGLFFPIDLGADALVGGMVSTNSGGARYLKYGDMRRNTLGLTVVLADNDGTILNVNTHLRKNNAGIDWKQIFIGTSGAFGVITECVLNLERSPRQCATALLVLDGLGTINRILDEFQEQVDGYLSAVEGMSRNAMNAAFEHEPSLHNPFVRGVVPAYALLVELTRSWAPRDGEQSLNDALMEA